MCDASSGEVIGLLALDRKRPSVNTNESTSPPDKKPQDKKDVFNQEVLGAVIEMVEKLKEDAKGLDHYGRLSMPLQKTGRR
jgi:hypothetical protein